jgi:RNA polymerase sigma-70 factor (ECF subfamily)
MKKEAQVDYEVLDDTTLAKLFATRDPGAVQIIATRNNQRLFRAAWSIVRNRGEAEDVVQTAYLRAWQAIDKFEGRSSLSTWLTRIAINEALALRRARLRRQKIFDADSVVVLQEYRDKLMSGSLSSTEPDHVMAREQLRRLLEEAIARLPIRFRMVFVLREIEQLSVAEVAQALGIPEATVKTRCLRACRKLRADLSPEIRNVLSGTFPFAGGDCVAMTARTLEQLRKQDS